MSSFVLFSILRNLFYLIEQFADANSTARKVLNMYPRPFTVFR